MSTLRSRTARARTILVAYRVLMLAALVAPTAAAAAGDAAHGEKLYKTCGICHSFDKNGQGPRHAGVFGRTAGTVPDFAYSPALKRSGIVWTEETLDKWLADPQALVPGSKMYYAVSKPQDRADVIEYLKQKGGVTKTNTPTP
jgi:cytochrome c